MSKSEKAEKTKKQHYVPRTYLEAWAMQEKYQVHVYDKKTDSYRINNIYDVAAERYFYDISPKEIFSQEVLSAMEAEGVFWSEGETTQGMEKFFANEIEGGFSSLLRDIRNKAILATPWIISNCYFISEEKKGILAAYLAIQHVRTKRARADIVRMADCVCQAMADMGEAETLLEECAVSKHQAKNIHTQMMLDIDHIVEIAKSFLNLTWMLCVNRTSKKIYTSDCPIGTHAHIKHPIMSMSGLQSKGVEAFFPISPDCILVMFDGEYHFAGSHLERRYVLIENEEHIDFYNSLCALNSERCVYSCDGEWELLEKMKNRNPNVFKQPHVRLSWGGKDYYPIN